MRAIAEAYTSEDPLADSLYTSDDPVGPDEASVIEFPGWVNRKPEEREEVRDVSETSERAQARLEAWDFAASYLAHLVDATRMIDSEELNQVMEEAEGRALDERANAAESLEEAEAGL